jgi:HAD superfamily hydrolase (TIGR01549 family)
MQPPEAVLFDAWNTLFRNTARPSPIATFNAILGKTFDDYQYLFAFEQHFALNKDLDNREALARFLNACGLNVTDVQRLQLLASLTAMGEDVDWFEDSIPCLQMLGLRYRLALVSNAGAQGAAVLRKKFELGKLFRVCTFSYEVGALKPAPVVFNMTLERLGVPASRAVFVGDHPIGDYQGAAACGLRPILIDRKGRYKDKGMERIASLSELKAALQPAEG